MYNVHIHVSYIVVHKHLLDICGTLTDIYGSVDMYLNDLFSFKAIYE